MKKILALTIAILMIFVLVSCVIVEVPQDSDDSTDLTSSTTNGDTGNHVQNQITFTGVVVVDNADCTIKITEIEADSIWGYSLKVQLENKANDKTYMFSVTDASINGIKCTPYFATEVAAGKKANDSISFTLNSLEKNGITEYTDIELTFRVYDSNDWMADVVVTQTVHVYPFGENKAEKYVRAPQASDSVLIDNEYVEIIVTGYEKDEIWGYTANLFLLNKSDKNIMFSVDESSVNGFMIDPFYAESLPAGKCAFSSISWAESALEENGITEVNEIEFIIRAYDEDNWLGDDFVNMKVTLNP